MKTLLISAVTATMLLLGGTAQAALIDDFNGGDITVPTANGLWQRTTDYANAVGGSRKLVWNGSVEGSEASDGIEVSGGLLTVTDATNPQLDQSHGDVFIRWEEIDPPVDLSDGNTSDRFRFVFSGDVDPTCWPSVTLRTTEAGDTPIEFTIRPTEPGVVDKLFTDLGRDGSDFDAVNYIQLEVRVCGPEIPSVAIDDISTFGMGPVNQAPQADPGGPYEGVAGEPVQFDGSGSRDPDGEIAEYAWEFHDDGATSAEQSPVHAFSSSGSYWVYLTVTDDDGVKSWTEGATADIGRGDIPPRADAGGGLTNTYNGTVGVPLQFDGSRSSDDVGIDSYRWEWGDDAVDGSGVSPQQTYTEAGQYTVTLTVTDTNDQIASDWATAVIAAGNQPPVADAGPPATGVAGEAVSFDGSASSDPDGTITQYLWDFDGDGLNFVDAGPTPSHPYAEPGTYHVTLTVTDPDDPNVSDSATTSANIAIDNQTPMPQAGGPYTGDVGVPIRFDASGSSDPDGSIQLYAWEFGDGTTDSGEIVNHPYEEAGPYTVTLTVVDDDGSVGENRTTATIGSDNEPPVADAGGPYSGVVGVFGSFDGRNSSDPDGTIAQYDWAYGDGNQDLNAGPTPSHSYAGAGPYDVTLTVTDNAGGQDIDQTSITISEGNVAPTANPGGPYVGAVGVAVSLDGSASSDKDGEIATYQWTWDDGSSTVGEVVERTYLTPGTYHATLTVTDDDDATGSNSTTVTVALLSEPPTAEANGPYSAAVDVPVSFDSTGSADSDGSIVQYDWVFGDGSVGSGSTTSHAYSATGPYNVTLTVTDDTGETGVDNAQVSVAQGNLLPVADAGPRVSGTPGAMLTFDGSASRDGEGPIASYDWEFGDGNSAINAGPSPQHVYANEGEYPVKLTVTDADGARAADSTRATVTDPTAIAASSLPSSRSVQVGNLASVFATIINGGNDTATECSIAPITSIDAGFAYQTTDAANAPTGAPNTPADISAGGAQNYIFGFLPTAPIDPTQVELSYACTNSAPAPVTVGVNTLLLSAEATPVPDIVALAATPDGDGILNLDGSSGSSAFAVATVNVGSTASITASPRTAVPLNVTMSICETDPATGACLSTPDSSTTGSVSGGATPTYSVFVTATGTVPFDPANNRIIVEFKDGGDVVRGSTSVAVRTQ